MKMSKFFVPVAVALAFLGLSACVSDGGKKPAKVSDKTEALPVGRVSSGTWLPEEVAGDNGKASSAPLPVLFTTASIDVEAARDPKAELKQRVVERWALLIAKRGQDAFDYLTPGYKQTHDRVKYGTEMGDRPVRWYRAAFDHSECASEDSCEVAVLVDFKVRISAGMGVTESFAYIKEQWIRIEGVWYHVPTDVGG